MEEKGHGRGKLEKGGEGMGRGSGLGGNWGDWREEGKAPRDEMTALAFFGRPSSSLPPQTPFLVCLS